MDAVGGELNAFTAKEYTCYYARVLDADLPLAIDVLSDMVTSSLIEPKDVDAERGVILEEIAMNDDDPSDTVHEAFTAQLFGDTPARPAHPRHRRLDQLDHPGPDRRALRGPVQAAEPGRGGGGQPRPRRGGRAGAVRVRPGAGRVMRTRRRRGWPGPAAAEVPAGTGVRLVSRGIEQANLVLGCAGLSRTDDRRFALGVLNAALGGGMSSRLFQEVREKRGLAYSVYSFSSQHADSGIWGVYAGCLPAKADEVLSICRDEIAKVISGGLTDDELERGKGQLRGSIVLGLEDPSSRMSRLGKSELVYPRLEPVDEILASIEAVTHDDVREVAADRARPAQGAGRGRARSTTPTRSPRRSADPGGPGRATCRRRTA